MSISTLQRPLGHEPLLHRERDAPGGKQVRPGASPSRAKPPLMQRANLIVAGLAALAVALVTGIGVATGPMRFDDEGTYVSQAISTLHGALSPYTYWYDHPPLGWILLAGWMGGPGALLPSPNPIVTGRYLMVLVAAVSAALIVLVLRRLGTSRTAGLVAALAFGFSPLAVHYHRMVVLDNFAVMFLLAAWLTALTPTRRLGGAALCGLWLAAAVLCKETLLLVAPFVIWALWRSRKGGTRAMSMTVFAATFLFPCLYYPLFALLKGELFAGPDHVSLWDGVMFQLVSRAGSGSVFDPASNAHAVVQGWFASDWYLLAAGAASAPFLLLRRNGWPLFGASLVSSVTLLRTGYLPVPYVTVLLLLAALALGVAIDDIGRWVVAGFRSRRVWAKVAAGAAAVALVAGAVTYLPAPLARSYERDRVYMTNDFDRPYREASDWLTRHAGTEQTIVVDNVLWTDLVDRDGRDPSTVIWYTKLGVDPAVSARVPEWDDIDYVVLTDIMRTGQRAGMLDLALERSTAVASWGVGSQQVEIRRVNH